MGKVSFGLGSFCPRIHGGESRAHSSVNERKVLSLIESREMSDEVSAVG